MALITLSPGPRNAYNDPKTGLRFYRWKGKDYPSVTTIRRLAGLPFGLHNWAVSRVIERAINEYDALGLMLTRPRRPRERVREKNARKEAGQWLRRASTEERDLAAALGTAVHDAATSLKDVADVDPTVARRLRQFYDWLDESRAEILATEKQVYNLRLGYAGTFDLIIRLPDGSVIIVDLKTGKDTYIEHAIQLMGYSMGEFIGEDDVVDVALTDLLVGASGMALLHLTDSGWRWQEVRATPELFEAFRGLLSFARFAHQHADIEGLLVEQVEGVAL